MKLLNVALVSLAALLGTGCYGSSRGMRSTSGDGGGAALFATGLLAGAIITSASEQQDTTRYERPGDREYPVYRQAAYQPIYVIAREDGTLVLPQGQPRQAKAAPPPPAPPSFDALRARNELAQVDLTKCRETGAPRGFGHAKVTFNPSGDISKVVIDEPAQMPASAAKCIGDEIGRSTIPVFSGSLVTVGTTWFVP